MLSKTRRPSGAAFVACMILLLALGLGGTTACDWIRRTPTPTVTPPPTPTVTPTPGADIPDEIVAARDAALSFLRETYPAKAPPEGIAWSGRDTTPPGVAGVSTYEFTSNGWWLTLAALALSPTERQYEVGLDHAPSGLRWTSRLSQTHEVLESNINVTVEVLIAREIVLGYVRSSYSGRAPAEGLVWLGERTTPSGVVGHESFRFDADSWAMTVEHDLVSPDQVIYEANLSGGSGFAWRGQVDAEGTVLEHR